MNGETSGSPGSDGNGRAAFAVGTARSEGLAALTKRQREVLARLAQGLTNGEIAAELGCSGGTVKVHVSAILDRLGAVNRTEAAAAWTREAHATPDVPPFRTGSKRNVSHDPRYLRARLLFDRLTPSTLGAALRGFRALTAARPDSAPAHLGVANCLNQMAVYRTASSAALLQAGAASAREALRLEPDLAGAHAALGYSVLFGRWDFDAAERQFAVAGELDPLSEDVPRLRSLLLAFTGRGTEAVAAAHAAIVLNPLSLSSAVNLAHVLRCKGALTEAIDQLRHALAIQPDDLRARVWLALTLADVNDRGAGNCAEALLNEYPNEETALGVGGYVRGRTGDRAGAMRCLRRLRVRHDAPFHEALVHLGLDRPEPALPNLRRAMTQRVPMLLGLRHDPSFAALRDHPAATDFTRRIWGRA